MILLSNDDDNNTTINQKIQQKYGREAGLDVLNCDYLPSHVAAPSCICHLPLLRSAAVSFCACCFQLCRHNFCMVSTTAHKAKEAAVMLMAFYR